MTTADATQARRFADFALSIASCDDVRTSRDRVVRAVGEYLDVPWVAMTRHRPDSGVHYIATTGDVVRAVARAAGTTREGLGWQLYHDNAVIVSDDLLAETRWPRFSRVVTTTTPLRSALAVPMRIDEETVGALVCYADAPRRFDPQLIETARALADQAGLALCYVGSRVRAAGLTVALRTNREIGMAIGIVMDRLRLTEPQALNLLVKASQNSHVKLRDLAARVVETGQLPTVARPHD
jgi:transcriptional regulator with GAF, ATPase, and Fis domain